MKDQEFCPICHCRARAGRIICKFLLQEVKMTLELKEDIKEHFLKLEQLKGCL
jgi:hypothetical protein